MLLVARHISQVVVMARIVSAQRQLSKKPSVLGPPDKKQVVNNFRNSEVFFLHTVKNRKYIGIRIG